MGRGGDSTAHTAPAVALRRSGSLSSLKSLATDLRDDLTTLGNLWFSALGKKKNADHAARLESFYGAQAETYDKFRANFLWGRRPMLAALAARLADRNDDLVWVDLGGGTGENVDMMSEYLPLDRFKAIYVVDLCHSLCEVAKRKAADKGWRNVTVVEGDACAFRPPEGEATVVTFSYSLSMIPPFIDAVDNATSWLAPDGLMGVCDFYVSARYDVPMRQMPWARRFFWRAVFDIDSIDIGPERRAYLETKLERAWEFNGQGSIPFVPYLRAPWFAWVGRPWDDAAKQLVHEQRVEAPPLFPPTFLYTQSWEDPEPDMQVMRINADDTVLTLTSGGCNALNLLLHGAGHVVSVDCNPAQSSLLELKKAAISTLSYEDVWQLFGEGKHPDIEALFERKLAPFLSQKAIDFWSARLSYFKQGLYWQGGMGKLCWVLQVLARALGLGGSVRRLLECRDLDEQRKVWDSLAVVRFVKHGPSLLVWLFSKALALVLFNRLVLWFGGGVPCKQYKLIVDDGAPIERYIGRTVDGIAEHSHLRTRNYFYYNCLTGRFARDCCPSYLTPRGFAALQAGAIDRLTISSGFFQDELKARTYTKVILMDHVDWLDDAAADSLAASLGAHVAPGGIVIWRSASLEPPYARRIEAAGFDVRCLQRATDGYMDRVNMYSSFYVATRRGGASGGAAGAAGLKD